MNAYALTFPALFIAMWLLLKAHADQPVMRTSKLLPFAFGAALLPLAPVAIVNAQALGAGVALDLPSTRYCVAAYATATVTVFGPVVLIYFRSRSARLVDQPV